jgi:hypothetical protein
MDDRGGGGLPRSGRRARLREREDGGGRETAAARRYGKNRDGLGRAVACWTDWKGGNRLEVVVRY